jgi:hypothetical protein
VSSVSRRYPQPLTKAASAKEPLGLTLVAKLKQIPWGALLGLAAAGTLVIAGPPEQRAAWEEASHLIVFIAIGLLIQRLVGWWVEPKLQALENRRRATLLLAEVDHYVAIRALDRRQARQLRVMIARRGVNGPPVPRGPRGPYKPRKSKRGRAEEG